MLHYTKKDIEKLSRKTRLNLINSITGIKPANLIGTISNSGQPNLAIFSSVVHLGSNPALIGFIVRPSKEVRRHTYENILQSKYYTINHVHVSFVEKAHYTSAKIDAEESEFERCKLTEEYLNNFKAPFVKQSLLKIGMKYMESIPININDTTLVIGSVEELFLSDEMMEDNGYLNLDEIHDVGISGLNSYYRLRKITSFPYARPHEIPDFE